MPSPCLPARFILAFMSFSMILVTQMLNADLYLALIDMERENDENGTDGNRVSSAGDAAAGGKGAGLRSFGNLGSTGMNWDKSATGFVLGAYYWTSWMGEIPGGLLVQKLGARKVLGASVSAAAVLNFFLPAAFRTHYLAASAVRALQGLALGVTWPTIHWLCARWIPQSERSKFMCVYQGTAVGNLISNSLCGFIISSYSWEYVFYVVGAVNLLWCLALFFFLYDSPSSHPRISSRELAHLKAEVGELAFTRKRKVPIPWKEILTSAPVWAVFVGSQGFVWGVITMTMQMSFYYNQVHRLDIKTNGLMSSIPNLGKFVFSLAFSWFIDRLISRKVMSVTAARKLAIVICQGFPALFLLLLGYYGHESIAAAAALFCSIIIISGASSSSTLANVVDISPVHAGIILALIKTATFVPGVLSPLVASHLTRDAGTGEDAAPHWRSVFVITAVAYVAASAVFVGFGSGEKQPWNSPPGTGEMSKLRAAERQDRAGGRQRGNDAPLAGGTVGDDRAGSKTKN